MHVQQVARKPLPGKRGSALQCSQNTAIGLWNAELGLNQRVRSERLVHGREQLRQARPGARGNEQLSRSCRGMRRQQVSFVQDLQRWRVADLQLRQHRFHLPFLLG